MDYNALQPGTPVHIVATNQHGILNRVDGEKYIVDLSTGEQVSVSMGEIEFLPVPPTQLT
jgi:hypothetical protein